MYQMYISHYNVPGYSGHLQDKDTFAWIHQWPLLTGFTVAYYVPVTSIPMLFILGDVHSLAKSSRHKAPHKIQQIGERELTEKSDRQLNLQV